MTKMILTRLEDRCNHYVSLDATHVLTDEIIALAMHGKKRKDGAVRRSIKRRLQEIEIILSWAQGSLGLSAI